MVREQSGRARARRWYWRQALAIGGRARGRAARAAGRSRRGRLAAADVDARGGWRIGLDARSASRLRARCARQPGHERGDRRSRWRSRWRPTARSSPCSTRWCCARSASPASIASSWSRRAIRSRGCFDRESVAAGRLPRLAPRDAHARRTCRRAEWWDANLSGIDTARAGRRLPRHAPTSSRRFGVDAGPRPRLSRRAKKRPAIIAASSSAMRCGAASSPPIPRIVGRTVRLDGEPYEVVGIAPPGLRDSRWARRSGRRSRTRPSNGPIGAAAISDGRRPARRRRDARAGARARSSAIAERQRREYPETNAHAPDRGRRLHDRHARSRRRRVSSPSCRPPACCCC